DECGEETEIGNLNAAVVVAQFVITRQGTVIMSAERPQLRRLRILLPLRVRPTAFVVPGPGLAYRKIKRPIELPLARRPLANLKALIAGSPGTKFLPRTHLQVSGRDRRHKVGIHCFNFNRTSKSFGQRLPVTNSRSPAAS